MSAARSWLLVNGALVADALVPATDRGFRYGMSVFETIALYRGGLLFGEEHLQRLRTACQAAEFAFPKQLTTELIRSSVGDLDDGVLRIYVTAGEGAPTSVAEDSQVVILHESMELAAEHIVAHGWKVGLSRAPFPIILGGWKTGNYWASVQALKEARRNGFDEAIVSNAQGALISASMGNLFLVRDGRVLTSSLSMGARDGAVRGWVIGREPVEETLLSWDDLESVEECFITNSRIGVVPVRAIEEKTLSGVTTGTRLAKLYREEILGSR